MATPQYEIYALKYAGPILRPAAFMTFFQNVDQFVQIGYFIFAIRSGDQTLLVDCGTSPKAAEARKIPNYVSPAEVLRRIGVQPSQIQHIICSHIHFDHIGGIDLFPQATFYVQEKEFRFWMKNPIAQKGPFLHLTDLSANRKLAKLKGTKRLKIIRGDRTILPGIRLLLAPGHTPGLQATLVHTVKGKALVGSDLAHMSLSYQIKIPSALITDLVAWMKSYDRVLPKASSPDLMFSGHDLSMLDHYPKVAEDVVRLV